MKTTHSFIVTGSQQQWGLIAQELIELGIQSPKEGGGGISFEGTLEDAYRICLWSRLANRVLMPIKSFTVQDQDELYSGVQLVDWYEHIPEGASMAVSASVQDNPALNHSHFVSLKTKDAIVDQLRDLTGVRPSVDIDQPDVRISLSIKENRGTLSIDLSGESLHKRGYRLLSGTAPLKETVAAAILYRAGWNKLSREDIPLVDPMCGSGTFCLEAASVATDLAPGLHRSYFGFLGWLGHDKKIWSALLEEAADRHREGRRDCTPIYGYDDHPKSIQISRANAETAGLANFIQFKLTPLHALENPQPNAETGVVVVNPPWGERLGTAQSLRPTYVELGSKLKDQFGGWQATLVTSDDELARSTGLRAHKRNTVYNGPIRCSVFQFDIRSSAENPWTRKAESGEGGEGGESGESGEGGEGGESGESGEGRESGDSAFANRLKKNVKRLKKWAKRENITCYRIYDRDLPEYAVAIDYYEGDVHIQEYSAPRDISPQKAQQRLDQILRAIPKVLEITPDKVHLKVRQRQRGSSQYQKQNTSNRFFTVREGPAKFWVNLEDYLDTGLFLDHRNTRALIGELSEGTHFLNLFAYTGTATVYAALGGARSTTTVDMSNTYLDWADRNFELNNLNSRDHRIIRADCTDWLQDCDQKFGLIFLDPPTFSNSKNMEGTFDIQRDHVELIQLTMEKLDQKGTLIFTNNFRRFTLDNDSLKNYEIEMITHQTQPEDFSRNKRIHQSWIIRHAQET